MSGGEYPISLVRVIDAVDERVLGADYKRLWRHLFELSRRPDGCTATARRLASRLGMKSHRTVETMRWELVQYGLLRRVDDRRAWYAVVPGDCVPSYRSTDDEIIAKAVILTEFLEPSVEQRASRFKRNPNAVISDAATGVPLEAQERQFDRPDPGELRRHAGGSHGERSGVNPRRLSVAFVVNAPANCQVKPGGEVEEGGSEGKDETPPPSLGAEGEGVALESKLIHFQSHVPNAISRQDPDTARLMEHFRRRAKEAASARRNSAGTDA